ncbi:MAG TPA: glycosyltransferase [Solirubrobacteraceae bacterium]|nr:glycosyltransferase [Solirubrobacteraceae bacterium]
MKVAFDGRPTRDMQGVGRYARCLLSALRETADGGREVEETHRPRRADVFHAPWMNGALLHSPCPMVVTLHDLTALKRRSELLRTGVRPALRQLAVQRAVRVIVPTQVLAFDAESRLGLEREQIDVIHEAPAASMYGRDQSEIAAVRARFALPERYLLWVGGLRHPDPSKHVHELAATPRELPLVLVGPTSPWAHELPDVILTGHVSDDELAALYSGAHALVVASENEGFGLPAVEALACGAPVVACDVPALREVVEGRVTFVEPCDMRALIAAAEAAARPAPPTPRWTWQDAARTTWHTYEVACAQGARAHTAGRLRRRRAAAAEQALAEPGS